MKRKIKTFIKLTIVIFVVIGVLSGTKIIRKQIGSIENAEQDNATTIEAGVSNNGTCKYKRVEYYNRHTIDEFYSGNYVGFCMYCGGWYPTKNSTCTEWSNAYNTTYNNNSHAGSIRWLLDHMYRINGSSDEKKYYKNLLINEATKAGLTASEITKIGNATDTEMFTAEQYVLWYYTTGETYYKSDKLAYSLYSLSKDQTNYTSTQSKGVSVNTSKAKYDYSTGLVGPITVSGVTGGYISVTNDITGGKYTTVYASDKKTTINTSTIYNGTIYVYVGKTADSVKFTVNVNSYSTNARYEAYKPYNGNVVQPLLFFTRAKTSATGSYERKVTRNSFGIDLKKVDMANTSTVVTGTQFEVKHNNDSSKTTTMTTGVLSVQNTTEMTKTDKDVYTITEKKANSKYIKYNNTITVTVNKKVNSNGVIVISKVSISNGHTSKELTSSGTCSVDDYLSLVWSKSDNKYSITITLKNEESYNGTRLVLTKRSTDGKILDATFNIEQGNRIYREDMAVSSAYKNTVKAYDLDTNGEAQSIFSQTNLYNYSNNTSSNWSLAGRNRKNLDMGRRFLYSRNCCRKWIYAGFN